MDVELVLNNAIGIWMGLSLFWVTINLNDMVKYLNGEK